MKIVIKKLTLSNFKGIKSLEIVFNHITNIYGENATGKTSIFDAFTWLFFGKDSTDRKDFEVKTLDYTGKVIPKIEHEVSAIVEIDAKPVEIKRVLREKWQKKRGSEMAEFTGNETLYYWNDVPLQQQQFQEKISDLLNETVFKLITNTLYFNQMKWQDRRSTLIKIAGEITNDEIIATNQDFASLIKLLGDKTMEEFKREMQVKKKKLKDDLERIPTRINEVVLGRPEKIDFEEIRSQLEAKVLEINAIDEQLQDASKVQKSVLEEIRNKNNQLHQLKTDALNIKNNVRSTFLDAHNDRKNNIQNLSRLVDNVSNTINNINSDVLSLNTRIDSLNKERAELRTKWISIDAEILKFNDEEFVCPSCKRPLEEGDITSTKEKLTNNFNSDKATRLTRVTEQGTTVAQKVEELQTKVAACNDELEKLSEQHTQYVSDLEAAKTSHENITSNSELEFNSQLAENKDFIEVNQKIVALEAELAKPATENNNSLLKEKKSGLSIELDGLKKQLNSEELIAKADNRIGELQAEEKVLSQQLAALEGNEYLVEQFTKTKMDLLESRINSLFKVVKFRMFEEQVNGGQVEACTTLVPDENNVLVPFTDTNNAAKINAGIDIINTLCDHYQVYAPIFIDNRESVTNIMDCNSQVINLIVSSADKKLRVA